MFEKFITKLYQRNSQKAQKKQQNKKLTQEEKQRVAMYKALRDLYSFVKWVNTKGCPNRHSRKDFWRRVQKGEPILENTILEMAKGYAEKPKEVYHPIRTKPNPTKVPVTLPEETKAGRGQKPVTNKPKIPDSRIIKEGKDVR